MNGEDLRTEVEAEKAGDNDSTAHKDKQGGESSTQQQRINRTAGPRLTLPPVPDTLPISTPTELPGEPKFLTASLAPLDAPLVDPSTFNSLPMLSLQQQAGVQQSGAHTRNTSRSYIIGGIIIVLLSLTLLSPVAFAIAHGRISFSPLGGSSQARNPLLIDGPLAWSLDTLQTAPPRMDAGFAHQSYALDPIFQPYYLRHSGALWLGTPITPAFIVHQGIVQFFEGGALLAPGLYALTGRRTSVAQPSAAHATTANDLSHLIIDDGVYDRTTGVEWLPLLHALLSVGSKERLLASGSATYAWLRAAIAPTALVAEHAGSQVASSAWVYTALGIGPSTPTTVIDYPTAVVDPTPEGTEPPASKPVFVAEGNSNGVIVGHYIPPQIWNALLRPHVAPDGWQADFGAPLSEALAKTMIASDGTLHHVLIQAFWEGVITYDLDAPSQDQAIAPLALGRAYLLTLGAPTAYGQAGLHAWIASDTLTPITTQPASGISEAHLGLNTPITLTGSATWRGAILCYGARWKTHSQHGEGWASAFALTLHAPPTSAPIWDGIDAISPHLARYLAALGANVGVAVYDITRNTYYVSNDQQVFIMASSAKVPLLVAYLAMLETEGLAPQPSDITMLSAMIEFSDNDAAQQVYAALGYDAGLDVYLQSIGITDYVRSPDGWGYGEWSPLSMAQLLTMLQNGQLLNADDTGLALSLMGNIAPDEQEGVGDTAPSGANYAMKDGWVQGPDGMWDVNSSGIVSIGSETYVISVYTQEQTSLESGWFITEQVCGPVGQTLA